MTDENRRTSNSSSPSYTSSIIPIEAYPNSGIALLVPAGSSSTLYSYYQRSDGGIMETQFADTGIGATANSTLISTAAQTLSLIHI